VLLHKEETVLQGIIYGLTVAERLLGWKWMCSNSGNENLKATMHNANQRIHKNNWNMWNISAMWLAWQRDMKPRASMSKAAIKKKKTHFTRILELYLKKKLQKYYIWSTILYSADIWTLWENISETWFILSFGWYPDVWIFSADVSEHSQFHLHRWCNWKNNWDETAMVVVQVKVWLKIAWANRKEGGTGRGLVRVGEQRSEHGESLRLRISEAVWYVPYSVHESDA
jgi:hypothetical protein